MKKSTNQSAEQCKNGGAMLSRTSIYLSRPKQKIEKKDNPPRKQRLPANKNDNNLVK